MTVAQIMGLRRSHIPSLQSIKPDLIADPGFKSFVKIPLLESNQDLRILKANLYVGGQNLSRLITLAQIFPIHHHLGRGNSNH